MKKTFLPTVAATVLCLTAAAQNTFIHPWQGKRVAFFGDSITDPRVKATNVQYWRYLADWLDITPIVYGWSGVQWNAVPIHVDSLLTRQGQDFDAILIFLGTNDYNRGIPSGEWFRETLEPVTAARGKPAAEQVLKKREPMFTNETFKGRINIALNLVKKTFPEKQVVLLTPIHRGYAKFGANNIQPDENYVNDIGEYIDAYIDAIKEAGNLWAVPVIDLNAVSGLFPLAEGLGIYFDGGQLDSERPDFLHPNAKGHRRMALTLYYQLLTIPCDLKE